MRSEPDLQRPRGHIITGNYGVEGTNQANQNLYILTSKKTVFTFFVF